MTIPKKIFQTWKNKTIEHKVLKQWQESWVKHNPDYEYIMWDDNDNRHFISTQFPEFLSIYDGYDYNIKRVDAVRYFYLYQYGGIYADLDFECLKSFDDLINPDDSELIFGSLGAMDTEKYYLHDIPNAIMMSKPKNLFLKFILNVLQNVGNKSGLCPEVATGPIFLRLCIECYFYNQYNKEFIINLYGKDIFENIDKNEDVKIKILEPNVLYPINWDNREHIKYRTSHLSNEQAIQLFPSSYAVTYWMHSW